MTRSDFHGLRGKHILITGGSRGIGRAAVRMLAECGATVTFTYNHSEDAANALQAELTEQGMKVLAIQADARDYKRAGEVVDQAIAHHGPLYGLVNNAAKSHYGLFEQLTEQTWDESVEGVLKVMFNYTHHVVPHLKAQQDGAIVNISSINGIRGREGSSAYGACKGAMNNFTKTLAREVGVDKVRVNAIAPGYVDTETQKSTPLLIKKLVRQECAIERMTTPEDVAYSIIFLLSPFTPTITGHILQIDSGQWI